MGSACVLGLVLVLSSLEAQASTHEQGRERGEKGERGGETAKEMQRESERGRAESKASQISRG